MVTTIANAYGNPFSRIYLISQKIGTFHSSQERIVCLGITRVGRIRPPLRGPIHGTNAFPGVSGRESLPHI